MTASGKTYRLILSALKDVSEGNTVFFVSDSVPHMVKAMKLAGGIVEQLEGGVEYSIVEKAIRFPFPSYSPGRLRFVLKLTYELYGEELKRGLRNTKTYFDLE